MLRTLIESSLSNLDNLSLIYKAKFSKYWNKKNLEQ